VILWGLFAPRVLKKNISFRQGGYGYTFTRLKEVNKFKDIDVLCIGSSHSYRGYDPRIFEKRGLKIFNLGTSSQTPIQTEFLVKKYLTRLNPRLVILDVYPVVFGNDGVESTLDLISNGKIDEDLQRVAMEDKNVKVYNTLIYGLFRQYLNLNEKFSEPMHEDGDSYVSGGYVETFRKYDKIRNLQPRAIKILPSQYNAFKRTTEFLKSKNIPYFIIQSPITRKSYESYLNNSAFDAMFRKLGPYYNANNDFNFPNSAFLDDHHLNQTGVNVYDKKIVKLVDSIGRDRNSNSIAKIRR
jgi:hypothetical protein